MHEATATSEQTSTAQIALELNGQTVYLSPEQAAQLQKDLQVKIPPSFDYELAKLETKSQDPAYLILQEVITDILASPEIDRKRLPEQKEFSLTGKHDTVLQMTVHDLVFNRSRMFYELWQGINDFGWLKKDEPGWQPPAVLIHQNPDSATHYTGKDTARGSHALEFRNHGTLDVNHLSLLASDDEAFYEKGGKLRDGGYGQGLKVALELFASTNQDRVGALAQYKTSKLGQANPSGNFRIDSKITELKNAPDQGPSYVTIQAREADKYDDRGNFLEAGRYYRAYVYRRPVQYAHGQSWAIDYLICWLDADQIPETDKNMVSIKIHHPDDQLAASFDGASANILALNRLYTGKKSLVAPEAREHSGTIRRFEFANADIFNEKDMNGTVAVEVMENVTTPAGIFSWAPGWSRKSGWHC